MKHYDINLQNLNDSFSVDTNETSVDNNLNVNDNDAIDNNLTTEENYDYNETIETLKMSIIRDAQLIREQVSFVL